MCKLLFLYGSNDEIIYTLHNLFDSLGTCQIGKEIIPKGTDLKMSQVRIKTCGIFIFIAFLQATYLKF